MTELCQGDIIRVENYKNMNFVIVSKNAFIRATGVFHVCPMLDNAKEGPLHIPVTGEKNTKGTLICEQIKLIDPSARGCTRKDRLSYPQVMNVSDALQGIFEYD